MQRDRLRAVFLFGLSNWKLCAAPQTRPRRCRTAAFISRRSNEPFLFREGGSPAEYGAGLAHAIAKGWLWKHESSTYVKFTQAGADLFS
jgi:hypothetical protein